MTSFIQSLDMRILESLYSIRDLTTTKIFIAITETGDWIFIAGLCASLGLYLLLRHRYAELAGLIVSVGGATVATVALKELVHRPRPDVNFFPFLESGYSLPSAHAALSLAFYGFVICLLWRLMPAGHARTIIASVLSTLVVAISFSRMYLGVHYASDVLAGLALGTVFLLLGYILMKKFER